MLNEHNTVELFNYISRSFFLIVIHNKSEISGIGGILCTMDNLWSMIFSNSVYVYAPQ